MAVDPQTVVALAGATLGGGWWFWRQLGRARLLEDMPTSRIRSAAQGYVEMQGTLLPGPDEPLCAPLTGKPCLWWHFRIEEQRSSGKRKSWQLLESGRSESWLGFADATGQCLINPVGAEVRPLHREVWHGSQRHPRGEPPQGWLGAVLGLGRRYRYIEERLHVGEPLYVLGEFRTFGGGRQGLDLATAQGAVVREWKQDFQGLLARFDRDGSGELNEQEWRLVRLAAQLEAEDRHRQASLEPEQSHLRKPAEDMPFLLSCRSEEDLVRSLRWQALAGALMCLVGALGLARVLWPTQLP